MSTYMLSTWIKSITGHLAYFQSKLNPEIDPTCRLCLQANNMGAAAYQLGNTSSRTITEVKQR